MKRITIFSLFAIAVFSTALTTSCTKEYIGEQKIASDCDTTTVKYSAQIKTIMTNNCVDGCHNPTDNSAGLDLTTYLGVKSSIARNLKERINSDTEPMPGSGKMAACKIKTIEKWIREGGLNN
jgi:hypothetical protein